MRPLFCLVGIAFLAVVTSCSAPVRLVGKAAGFVLETGINLTWKVAKGIGRIGTKEAVHAIDLTADAAIQVLAQKESRRLVDDFWHALQTKSVAVAYRMVSADLKRQFPKNAFAAYIGPWAGHIAAYELMALTVRQFHVEVPTQLSVKGQEPGAKVGVTVYVSNVNNQWQITGWEADTGR